MTYHQLTIPILLNSTSINIKLENNIVQISTVYKGPDSVLKLNDLNVLTNYGDKFIIAGNLNAKYNTWYSNFQNKAGRTLFNHSEKSNTYSIEASETHTYYPFNPKHRSDVLDIFLLNIAFLSYFISNQRPSGKNTI